MLPNPDRTQNENPPAQVSGQEVVELLFRIYPLLQELGANVIQEVLALDFRVVLRIRMPISGQAVGMVGHGDLPLMEWERNFRNGRPLIEQMIDNELEHRRRVGAIPQRERFWASVEAGMEDTDILQRAHEFLLAHLDEEQKEQYRAMRSFDVVTSHRNKYRIREAASNNVRVMAVAAPTVEGIPVPLGSNLCVVPSAALPLPDAMLMQKLMLETDEANFLRIAMGLRHDDWGPGAVEITPHRNIVSIDGRRVDHLSRDEQLQLLDGLTRELRGDIAIGNSANPIMYAVAAIGDLLMGIGISLTSAVRRLLKIHPQSNIGHRDAWNADYAEWSRENLEEEQDE